MSLTPYKPSDFLLFGCKALPAFAGAYRVSQVLVRFSTYMPRPDDSDRPSRISPFSDSFVLASVVIKTSPSAFLLLTELYQTSGECVSPCGLHVSLCTLRVGRSARLLCQSEISKTSLTAWRIWSTCPPCSRNLSDGSFLICVSKPPSQSRNTRYGWVANPCPIGTYTL